MTCSPQEFTKLQEEVHAKLGELQFGEIGPDAKYLVIPQDEFGFGAQLSRRVLGLKLAYLSSRTAVFTSPDYGPYEQCFEDTGKVPYDEIKDLPSEDFRIGEDQDCQVATFDFEALWADQPRFWEVHDSAPLSFTALGLDFRSLEGIILQWMKPLPWFCEQIDSIRERIGFTSPIIGVHIRRGDKFYERPYVPLRKYHQEIRRAVEKTGISRVFVTSDDPDIFEDLPDQGRIEYIYDKEEPRYNNQNHRLIESQPDLRRQETLTALKIYELMRRSDYVVGQDNAHLTTLAVNRRLADQFGKCSAKLISGDYTMRFQHADIADWNEVLVYKARSFCKTHRIPGVRTTLTNVRKKVGLS